MTDNPVWLDKLNKYFADAVSVHEVDLQTYRGANRFVKWWLEQIRNLLTVSALFFLAEKSDSWLLKVLANITFFVFFFSFTSWQNTFSIRLLPYIKNQRANLWINLIIWMLIMMPIWYLGIIAVTKSFIDLTKISAR